MLAATLVLSSCGGSVELIGSLPEKDANDVLGALLSAGIDAHKVSGKTGISIIVEQAVTAHAIETLRQQGLPRERHVSMGDIFKKENLVSSPLEERVRYLYALSKELEYTLSQIDGVIVSRVHLVLPERLGPGEPAMPSSASVFLKHKNEYGVAGVTAQVRGLIASSIPGLTQDKVSVVLVPAMGNFTDASAIRIEKVLFFNVEKKSAAALRILLGTFVAVVLLAIAAGAYLFMRNTQFEQTAIISGLRKLIAFPPKQ